MPHKIIPYSDVIDSGYDKIHAERKGENKGLRTRWIALNNSIGKFFRFNQTHLISGSSGSGKSFILTMLRNDFFNTKLNNLKARNLHFCFEMPPEDEAIRSIGAKLKLSYSDLISAKLNTETNEFTPLPEEQLKRVEKAKDDLRTYPVDYVVGRMTTKTMNRIITAYKKQYPDWYFVFSVDHHLLINPKVGENEFDLAKDIANLAMDIRDERSMNVILAQFNENVKKAERIKNKELHYPVTSDIYGSKHLNWAADNVLLFHRPENIGITKYGIFGIPTGGLVHCRMDKARYGKVGDIFFKEEFGRSNMILNKDAKNFVLSKIKKQSISE